ncbi:hypothetical protein GDO81_012760 [Engystomops pustulosus]|uniref:Uncharacterized protein n=1 Tax=Engystomops pustulosus TaxID=76066 RepID=A0AAV7AVN0_ENGPU|nr:hypothetical protein GDO81_012760 [Engystomops pustulosus]
MDCFCCKAAAPPVTLPYESCGLLYSDFLPFNHIHIYISLAFYTLFFIFLKTWFSEAQSFILWDRMTFGSSSAPFHFVQGYLGEVESASRIQAHNIVP